LEKYFGATLRASSRALSRDDAAYLESTRVPWDRVPPEERESWVSRTLVTQIRETDILFALAAVFVVLVVAERLAAARLATAPVIGETRAR
jgi:hypothetical protein